MGKQRQARKKKAKQRVQEAPRKSRPPKAIRLEMQKNKGNINNNNNKNAKMNNNNNGTKKKKKNGGMSRKQYLDLLYKEGDRALIVGDGDLSFSRAVSSLVGPENVTATVYDRSATLVAKYPNALSHAEVLEAEGAQVICGVDATRLNDFTSAKGLKGYFRPSNNDDKKDSDSTDANDNGDGGDNNDSNDDADGDSDGDDDDDNGVNDGDGKNVREITAADLEDAKRFDFPSHITHHLQAPFDSISFHFPHTGSGDKSEASNVAEQQRLISSFFHSAKPLLARDSKNPGKIIMTIKRGERYDKWAVVRIATKEAGLKVKNCVPFDFAAFPGYRHRRTIGFEKGRSAEDNEDVKVCGGRTFIFVDAEEYAEESKI